MQPPIAETRVPVKLGDRDLIMYFNANTMCAYEEATKKFFLDTVFHLYDMIFPEGHLDENGQVKKVKIKGVDLVRKISMIDLRALLWSSIHEYDSNDEPSWPLTQVQVGRKLNMINVIPIFIAFLTGANSNSPTKSELGESQADEERDGETSAEKPIIAESGGGAGIVLPADALD